MKSFKENGQKCQKSANSALKSLKSIQNKKVTLPILVIYF